jgi:hypothetical protein
MGIAPVANLRRPGLPHGGHSEVALSCRPRPGTLCKDWHSRSTVHRSICGLYGSVCGAMLIGGFYTTLAVVPLLIVILIAIATTKVPMLVHQGFWAAMHEARADFCMLLGLIPIALLGAGDLSIDGRRRAG